MPGAGDTHISTIQLCSFAFLPCAQVFAPFNDFCLATDLTDIQLSCLILKGKESDLDTWGHGWKDESKGAVNRGFARSLLVLDTDVDTRVTLSTGVRPHVHHLQQKTGALIFLLIIKKILSLGFVKGVEWFEKNQQSKQDFVLGVILIWHKTRSQKMTTDAEWMHLYHWDKCRQFEKERSWPRRNKLLSQTIVITSINIFLAEIIGSKSWTLYGHFSRR